MRAIRRILVAIKDPDSRRQPALAKAAQLARAFGAELQLFHALSGPVPLDGSGSAGYSARDIEHRLHAAALRGLEALARRLDPGSARITVSVEWDYPAAEAIVRQAQHWRADLIVAERHAGRHALGWLLSYTDWELLRLSHVAVLLVKQTRPYRNPVVLAAVDPSHAFAKPARLDEEILQIASSLRMALRGTLHVMHAYMPVPIGTVAVGVPDAGAIERIQQRAAAEARAGFARLLRGMTIPKQRRHLSHRHPIDAIEEVARAVRSDILVMGAVSRSGLKRLFIGNTAERVLDALPCDVLVAKPPRFAAQVARRRRGIRYVTMPMAA